MREMEMSVEEDKENPYDSNTMIVQLPMEENRIQK